MNQSKEGTQFFDQATNEVVQLGDVPITSENASDVAEKQQLVTQQQELQKQIQKLEAQLKVFKILADQKHPGIKKLEVSLANTKQYATLPTVDTALQQADQLIQLQNKLNQSQHEFLVEATENNDQESIRIWHESTAIVESVKDVDPKELDEALDVVSAKKQQPLNEQENEYLQKLALGKNYGKETLTTQEIRLLERNELMKATSRLMSELEAKKKAKNGKEIPGSIFQRLRLTVLTLVATLISEELARKLGLTELIAEIRGKKGLEKPKQKQEVWEEASLPFDQSDLDTEAMLANLESMSKKNEDQPFYGSKDHNIQEQAVVETIEEEISDQSPSALIDKAQITRDQVLDVFMENNPTGYWDEEIIDETAVTMGIGSGETLHHRKAEAELAGTKHVIRNRNQRYINQKRVIYETIRSQVTEKNLSIEITEIDFDQPSQKQIATELSTAIGNFENGNLDDSIKSEIRIQAQFELQRHYLNEIGELLGLSENTDYQSYLEELGNRIRNNPETLQCEIAANGYLYMHLGKEDFAKLLQIKTKTGELASELLAQNPDTDIPFGAVMKKIGVVAIRNDAPRYVLEHEKEHIDFNLKVEALQEQARSKAAHRIVDILTGKEFTKNTNLSSLYERLTDYEKELLVGLAYNKLANSTYKLDLDSLDAGQLENINETQLLDYEKALEIILNPELNSLKKSERDTRITEELERLQLSGSDETNLTKRQAFQIARQGDVYRYYQANLENNNYQKIRKVEELVTNLTQIDGDQNKIRLASFGISKEEYIERQQIASSTGDNYDPELVAMLMTSRFLNDLYNANSEAFSGDNREDSLEAVKSILSEWHQVSLGDLRKLFMELSKLASETRLVLPEYSVTADDLTPEAQKFLDDLFGNEAFSSNDKLKSLFVGLLKDGITPQDEEFGESRYEEDPDKMLFTQSTFIRHKIGQQYKDYIDPKPWGFAWGGHHPKDPRFGGPLGRIMALPVISTALDRVGLDGWYMRQAGFIQSDEQYEMANKLTLFGLNRVGWYKDILKKIGIKDEDFDDYIERLGMTELTKLTLLDRYQEVIRGIAGSIQKHIAPDKFSMILMLEAIGLVKFDPQSGQDPTLLRLDDVDEGYNDDYARVLRTTLPKRGYDNATINRLIERSKTKQQMLYTDGTGVSDWKLKVGEMTKLLMDDTISMVITPTDAGTLRNVALKRIEEYKKIATMMMTENRDRRNNPDASKDSYTIKDLMDAISDIDETTGPRSSKWEDNPQKFVYIGDLNGRSFKDISDDDPKKVDLEIARNFVVDFFKARARNVLRKGVYGKSEYVEQLNLLQQDPNDPNIAQILTRMYVEIDNKKIAFSVNDQGTFHQVDLEKLAKQVNLPSPMEFRQRLSQARNDDQRQQILGQMQILPTKILIEAYKRGLINEAESVEAVDYDTLSPEQKAKLDAGESIELLSMTKIQKQNKMFGGRNIPYDSVKAITREQEKKLFANFHTENVDGETYEVLNTGEGVLVDAIEDPIYERTQGLIMFQQFMRRVYEMRNLIGLSSQGKDFWESLNRVEPVLRWLAIAAFMFAVFSTGGAAATLYPFVVNPYFVGALGADIFLLSKSIDKRKNWWSARKKQAIEAHSKMAQQIGFFTKMLEPGFSDTSYREIAGETLKTVRDMMKSTYIDLDEVDGKSNAAADLLTEAVWPAVQNTFVVE